MAAVHIGGIDPLNNFMCMKCFRIVFLERWDISSLDAEMFQECVRHCKCPTPNYISDESFQNHWSLRCFMDASIDNFICFIYTTNETLQRFQIEHAIKLMHRFKVVVCNVQYLPSFCVRRLLIIIPCHIVQCFKLNMTLAQLLANTKWWWYLYMQINNPYKLLHFLQLVWENIKHSN